MTKTPFVSKEVLETITEQFPTPFHLYDEKGIREKACASMQHLHGTKALRSILRSRRHRHPLF